MALSSCPVCGGRNFKNEVPAAAIRAEIDERNDFVFSRLGRTGSAAELKDLTDFMHGNVAPLFTCTVCGLAVRVETKAASYDEDPNDSDLMQQVYPRYVEFFRKKKSAFADRLPPHASVIELGSHLGGFLQVGEEWNWRPVGLDIGRDTSEFARNQGLTVRRETIEDTRISAGSADAVFIWNCFEQLSEPVATLEAAYRLLRPFGLLVVRVPNASFYLGHRNTRPDWLAWNNLLGFPYLYGYSVESLNRLIAQCGFEPVRGFNSELLTMPFADVNARIATEQRAVSDAVARASLEAAHSLDILTGPWIEVIYRKHSEVQRRRPRVDCRFLERAA